MQPLPAADVSLLEAPQCLCWIQISLRELRTLPLWDSGVYGQAPKSRHGFWLRLGSLRISKIELSLKREHDFQSGGDTPKIDSLASHLASFWTLPAELFGFWAAPSPLPAEPGTPWRGLRFGKRFFYFLAKCALCRQGSLEAGPAECAAALGEDMEGGRGEQN